MKHIILYSLALVFLLSACTTNYYIVRHAEKADNSPNTPLSVAGFARAQVLLDSLDEKEIKHVYVSNFLRTQQTAEPTADFYNHTPVEYDAINGIPDLIIQLRSLGNKEHALVVSHSNLVPVIIDSLMRAPQGIQILETDYDNLYRVQFKKCLSTKRTLFQSTYGQPTN